ncbi:MAG: undecaprenyl/decaprenyl-phosphate alpha-N-acetylglucosaminyl 1-phosphate transferase [Acidimicrobiia bacterium]|nr:undecaprenyl/decaprenyl-phosphate alpha-N-acetylglucosaminyl 1-phosphate transferase [Acidimicrobiia bacterium]MBJ7512784.1 undecaprenyl/decaprenyl-phosphate alpha-N-acetylglucosaminyl 1-phosphate transferase [Acidimicrobiia bacterium]
MNPFVGLITAFVVTCAMTPIAIRVAHRTGMVDRPGSLKVQSTPVAYLGGVAVFAGVFGALAATTPRVLIPLALALLLGLFDDRLDISPRIRVICEAVIALIGGALVPAGDGALGVAITALLILGLLNAVNLLDGLDGLAAGVCSASAIGFAFISEDLRLADPRLLALSLLGALIGFLIFNRPPARIYLGDAGAYLIGVALAILAAQSLNGASGTSASIAIWAALPLIVAVPILDTLVAIVRRLRAGNPIFSGDRSHIYDQLCDRGIPAQRVAVIMVSAQCVLVLLGILASRLSSIASVSLMLLSAGILIAITVRAGFLTTDGGQ